MEPKKKNPMDSYVTSDKDHVGANKSKPVNVSDIPKMERELKDAIGTPNYEVLKSKYEGPNTGLDYNEETGKLVVSSQWYVNPTGEIVKKPVVNK